jgi:hypothetical protein
VNLDALRAVADRWREEAERYEADGVPGHAALLRRVADELMETLGKWWTEPLGLQQAAEEAGLNYRAIQKRIERRQVPNAGRKGAPLVRRCDLYDGGGPMLEAGEPDLAEEILVSLRTGA